MSGEETGFTSVKSRPVQLPQVDWQATDRQTDIGNCCWW